MRSNEVVLPPERYYYRSSTGAPVVLIHGFGGTWRNWDPVLPLLETSCSVLAPTLAGHWGGSPVRGWPTVESMVDDVEALMDELGIGTAHAVGHSLGAWVALELLRRGRALSVLGLCPAAAWPTLGQRAALFRRLVPDYGKARLIAPRAELLLRSRWVRRYAFHSFTERPEALAPGPAAVLLWGTAYCPTFLRALVSLGRISGIRPLPAHRSAVRVVWAEKERVVPAARFREALLERIGPVAETTVEGAGHLLVFEDPRRTARLLLDNVLGAVPGDGASGCRDRNPPEGSG